MLSLSNQLTVSRQTTKEFFKIISYFSTATVQWLPRLRAAAAAGDLSAGRRAHALTITSGGALDLFLTNNLITLYCKCVSLGDARNLFDAMPRRDSVSYNSLLSAYAQYGLYSESMELFKLVLQSPKVRLTAISFTQVIKVCCASVANDVIPGSLAIHCCSIKHGLDCHRKVVSSLICLYMNFGMFEEGRYLFDGICDKDIAAWNIMIDGYAKFGLENVSFGMFCDLQKREYAKPDEISVRCLLVSSDEGMIVEQVRAYGLKTCLFDDQSDVVSWNRKMSFNTKIGETENVLKSFMEMKRLDIEQDSLTFVIMLSAISNSKYPEFGKQIHAMALKAGFCSAVSVLNNLMKTYARIPRFDCARRVFNEIDEKDMVSWNSMISLSAQSGFQKESILLFLEMLKYGFVPDGYTLTSVLRACSGAVQEFCLHEQLHTWAIKVGWATDTFLQTSLIDVYAKKGGFEQAESLYHQMDFFDLASYNALLTGYILNKNSEKVLDLFMSTKNFSEKYNFPIITTVLKACSDLAAFQQGKQVHAHAIKLGNYSDLWIKSAILEMYIKCGSIKDAIDTFTSIDEPDDVAWTSIISGCIENGRVDYAFIFYNQLRRLGFIGDEYILASLVKACSSIAALQQGSQIHANSIKQELAFSSFVATSLMDMYAKCGKIEYSYKIFERMEIKPIASWNSMVLAFAQHGNGQTALQLLENMRHKGIKPDKITFVGVLSACSHSGSVSEAYNYFNIMKKNYGIDPGIEHFSCFVDVLCRSGRLSEAQDIIETMPFVASLSMYKTLLYACRNSGNVEMGRRIESKLLALDPQDSSSYVLLSNVYASAERWNEVFRARESMRGKSAKRDSGSSWVG